MAKYRVLALMHESLVPPDTLDGYTAEQIHEWRTEFDVVQGLRSLGHEVVPLGVSSDLSPIRKTIESLRPHVTFNLLEEFHQVPTYDQAVVSYLELLKRPYTGCNPRGLMLARDKALSKKILAYHKIPVPKFAVFEVGRKVRRPKRLEFPLIVKSLTAEGSEGIAKASLVHSDDKLAERVAFIHRSVGTDAIAEQFIPGRELYVGVLGNIRTQALPPWELLLENQDKREPLIATSKVKWDEKYQDKIGWALQEVIDLDAAKQKDLATLAKRIYRRLGLSGYARLDFRLTEDGQAYLLEANPNPQIAEDAEFATAASAAGLPYDKLLDRILRLGLGYRPAWKED